MPRPIDLSEFEALGYRRIGVCVCAQAIAKLADEDREKVHAALEAQHISSVAIRAWLGLRGEVVSKESIRLHRRRDCACARS